ncbi:hypothetical protein HOQ56_gp27 [uncultured phage_MedDCM-OCT-S38-C3]|uniref:Uncharacterized protein n=1 Tax=uncultured phage_MedDCM-OCT-S38-C3 TaxID=2740803 RepID=A0A6S4PA61_9CAUD|nr:hypothetical protein HOQ56_gp27 [uncultured phage_MedDCM-OCT-S38-C3]BAQ94452.1 hypothetical protein [uncultured phage_MedDCM-OCT-S38-C3]
MTLPCDGEICMEDVVKELSLTGNACLNNAAIRDLAGKPSGKICFDDLYCKSKGGSVDDVLLVVGNSDTLGYAPLQQMQWSLDPSGKGETEEPGPVPEEWGTWFPPAPSQYLWYNIDFIRMSPNQRFIYIYFAAGSGNQMLLAWNKAQSWQTASWNAVPQDPWSGGSGGNGQGAAGADFTHDNKFMIAGFRNYIYPNGNTNPFLMCYELTDWTPDSQGRPQGANARWKTAQPPWVFDRDEMEDATGLINPSVTNPWCMPKGQKTSTEGVVVYNSGSYLCIWKYHPTQGLTFMTKYPHSPTTPAALRWADRKNGKWVVCHPTNIQPVVDGLADPDNQTNILQVWQLRASNYTLMPASTLQNPWRYKVRTRNNGIMEPDYWSDWRWQTKIWIESRFGDDPIFVSEDRKWICFFNAGANDDVWPAWQYTKMVSGKEVAAQGESDATIQYGAEGKPKTFDIYFGKWNDSTGVITNLVGFNPLSPDPEDTQANPNRASGWQWLSWDKDMKFFTIGGVFSSSGYHRLMQTYKWDNSSDNPVGERTWNIEQVYQDAGQPEGWSGAKFSSYTGMYVPNTD